jgi:hypothetical protein
MLTSDYLQTWAAIVKKLEDLLEGNTEVLVHKASEGAFKIRRRNNHSGQGNPIAEVYKGAFLSEYGLKVWPDIPGCGAILLFLPALRTLYVMTEQVFNEGTPCDTTHEVADLAKRLKTEG